ncbi:hypothetical protein B0T25DRAFT_569309 [Lasiosphaeria hispida]|uniref:Uncharacterized protein n=1 Tax=Lasiosphaeria hispida TaxID=260671 RepID=A0AAJ0HD25_9PEZI|nr:hypothetical protein B0T25DRAFT_569309 [Lasiosphaeria hispida]
MYRLAIISLLLSPATALSVVWGDVATKRGPYGIPASVFTKATSSPRGVNAFLANGDNTSIPAGPVVATGYDSRLDEWDPHFNITADVSRAELDDGTDVDSQFFEATTLAISPLASLSSPGFNNGADVGGSSSGCESVLPSDCTSQLQANSVAANASSNGECVDLAIPSSCEGHFVDGVGSTYDLAGLSAVANDNSRGQPVPIFAVGLHRMQNGQPNSTSRGGEEGLADPADVDAFC